MSSDSLVEPADDRARRADARDSPADVAPADVDDLFADLDDLTDDAEAPTTYDEIQQLKGFISEAHERGLIDSRVRRLRASDAVEAFVGSVIFASPLLVEGGVFDIADYLFGFTFYGVPVFLIANTIFVVTMTYALVEWTGKNREETQLLFGRIPTRVVMILVVSFLTATVLMTVWGRVGDWRPPTEALARINVIWTVGSLGAALGDILSEHGSSAPVTGADEGASRGPPNDSTDGRSSTEADGPPDATDRLTDGALVDAIFDQYTSLESLVHSQEERREVQRLRERTSQAAFDTVFGDRIRKYTTRDIAEAFVGSIFFSVPFLVEDGVFDVADYFLAFQIGGFPVFFIVNTAFVLLMVTTLVYWAGPQDVQMSRPVFGFIPRRMVGISVVSFLTATALMTMWGRVGNWHDPVVAIARINVVWSVASFGAALGDILPGESSGDDINDDLAELGDRVEEFVE